MSNVACLRPSPTLRASAQVLEGHFEGLELRTMRTLAEPHLRTVKL